MSCEKICLETLVRPTPRTLGADVPDEVESVLEAALAFDPSRRHRDVGLFWGALRKAAGLSAQTERGSSKSLASIPRVFPSEGTIRFTTATTAPTEQPAPPSLRLPAVHKGWRAVSGRAMLFGIALLEGSSPSTSSGTVRIEHYGEIRQVSECRPFMREGSPGFDTWKVVFMGMRGA